ncbi:MAG: hypothetical protein A2W22_06915 [Candidatus Levybacteria bacterium RBG_16_35_11]|nr:MAG: hypothetical protein A2W22_06915 [Candidatus Levybacteria bacterium RBG_16_35_11]
MGEVIYLPTRIERFWSEYEKETKDYLKLINASAEMTNHICAKLKKVFFSYEKDFSFNINIPLPEGLSKTEIQGIISVIQDALAGHMQKLSNFWWKAFKDRLLLEIELYKCQHGQ